MNIWTRGAAGAAVCAVLLLTGCGTSDVSAGPNGTTPLDAAAAGTDLAPVVGEWKEVTEAGDTPWTIRVSEDGAFRTTDGSDTCEGTVKAVPSEADKTWRHFLADADCGWAGRQLAPLKLGEEGGKELLILTNDSGEGSEERYIRAG
ncbi:hypothetical protein [Streptomyces sp. NPDC004435]|uniref:hypothetical protein n=1 Tax=Streptomyces sp. NPDC004435 TaxID=3364701 RepID=UPI0036BA10AD